MTDSERANNFLWNTHTALVDKTIKPGSIEDKRFLALALCGEVGEIANLVKKEWRGDVDPKFLIKLEDEVGDVYAYMQLLACAHDIEFKNPNKLGYSLAWGNFYDVRFCALSLQVQAGKIAEKIELEWANMIADGPDHRQRLRVAIQDFYVQLKLFATKINRDLDEVLERVTLPKIRARWQRPDGTFDGAKPNAPPTHYVHCNAGNALFVKEANFFAEQGGLTEQWGKAWQPVVASSIGDARRQAAAFFGVRLSPIHGGEK